MRNRCSSLTSITIRSSVTSIGMGHSKDALAWISIAIPDSVTGIGYHAFSSCTSLTSVTIPSIDLGEGAFALCGGLVSVTDWQPRHPTPASSFYVLHPSGERHDPH